MSLDRGLAAAVGLALGVAVSAEELPTTDPRWELSGPSIKREAAEGRELITADSGLAVRRDVRLEDGTIAFDVRLTRRRSFVYLKFRMQDDGEYEEIYLRPHKSGLPDAVQYTPVYQGQSAWQLHHGPGATAAVEFATDRFTRVRLVLQGTRAALFVGDGVEPALVMPALARTPRAGYIALRCFVPPGTPGAEPAARFANVSIDPGRVDYDFGTAAAPPTPAPGVIRSWAVSQALTAPDGPEPRAPSKEVLGAFSRVDAPPSGLVELHRHVRIPKGSREAGAAARVFVRAAQAGVRALDLGFSDRATVFLNGVALFEGDASYSFDAPRREGLIGFDQARLFLPLRQGENELLVVVRDGFGGMGLMARYVDASGLETEAR